jgi:RNA polymerase sigma factor for flagellar operon FliA
MEEALMIESMTEEERDRIVQEFLPYIKYTAQRLSWRLPPQLTTDDLVSVGIVGLLDGLSRFRNNGTPLKSFVEMRIKGAMLDEIRSQFDGSKSIKRKMKAIKDAHNELERELGRLPEDEEIAESLNISLDEYYRTLQRANSRVTLRFEDFPERNQSEDGLDITECIPDTKARTPLEVFETKDTKERLARLISELPEKEKLVLSLYYWEELTMKEIARVLEITEGRVSQIHNHAIMRLRAKMEDL